jgi:D-3-phosphoglycerate dehydrogenase
MKVLITDMRHSSIEEERRVLEPAGVVIDTTFSESEGELIANGRGAVGFLVSYARITRKVMESLPELKIIVKYGIGVDNIDVEAAKDLGKMVANVPDYCVEEVALQSLTLTVAGLRLLYPFAEAVKNGNWVEDLTREKLHRPSTLTAGTLGFGRIARRFASYLRPITARILFYDPFVSDPGPEYGYCEAVDSLSDLIDRCRILSVHAPLTAETHNLLDAEMLGRARELLLVNTSRAGIVEREALEAALDDGRVAYYGADVFWQEPADFSDPSTLAFLRRRNVLVSPHMSWYSEDSEREVRRKAAEEVLRVIQGEPPLHLVSS